MLDRKQMLLLADNKFKDGVYADETLELVDRCIEIVNEESSEFEFNEFEDDPRINSSLRGVQYKKFLKDKLDLSNRDTAYFVGSFVWKNHVENVLRWFINQMY